MSHTRFYEPALDVLNEELKLFEQDIAEFVAGKIDPVKFKAIRVAHGVYEQRQPHTYMIRIRCAAGGITPAQLIRCAEVGQKYGSGEVHFTTRSEVQVHDVKIENVLNVIYELLEVGLSTRGGGGNTIRNILTSSDSGVSTEEAFDVDPYAIALTTRMIHEADSWNLPRKFKIAFSHNTTDTAFTQATCLGFVATIQNGQKGFEVYCAGGMGAKPMVGHQLIEFIPDTQVYHVTRAIKTMFDKHGNRRNRYANRIKFLWKKIEREEFLKLFYEEYDKIKHDDSLNLVLDPIPNTANDPNIPPQTVTGPEFETWKKRYVTTQKQPGLVSIKLPLILGDLLSNEAKAICDFLAQFGDNTIRCDRAQNMRIRNIPEKYLGNLYTIIQNMNHHLANQAPFIGNMINCTGAQTCKLGICLPRGLSTAIRDSLISSALDLDQISDLRVNMSGCPNTCGMHHIADIGFFGKVGRKDGDMFPAYNVLAGAKIGKSGETEYAQKVDEISAKDIPSFMVDLLSDYIPKKSQFKAFPEYLDAGGRDLIKTLCDKYRDVPSFAQNPDYYTDWGAKKKLSLDELGTAECSAGMFDMIEVDEKAIKTHKKALQTEGANEQEELYKILFAASRMLLVTRGLDAKEDTQVFEYFGKHFIEAGLIDRKYMDVVTLGKLGLAQELPKHKDAILELAEAVISLYKSMDDSLKFRVPEPSAESAPSAVVEKDFRGVACPMNFVKTKLALDTLNSGQQLKILIDDGEPIQNVPNSVALEGHKILSKTQNGSYWEVVIEKK
jgi:sulfite reductase (ferredoxin)